MKKPKVILFIILSAASSLAFSTPFVSIPDLVGTDQDIIKVDAVNGRAFYWIPRRQAWDPMVCVEKRNPATGPVNLLDPVVLQCEWRFKEFITRLDIYQENELGIYWAIVTKPRYFFYRLTSNKVIGRYPLRRRSAAPVCEKPLEPAADFEI